ncbi:hypothetical protein [Marinifilum caeruleilacunae]|uniref:Uncharacterized protein n=1 Tax=Marinifilum caeruleilacunae TaxID=2499076 RepID=A0ABX1WSM8_9BACT|nr:hypothetical protein [Marinifilum caeruleilacunae]NOU59096.1 hypothetical protein [Marinifilum caeruleilacunae]
MQLIKALEEKKAVRMIAKENQKVNFNVANARIEKDMLWLRKELSGKSGIQQLIKPQDAEKDGVRNIDSAKLTSGTAFLVTGILISTASLGAPLANESEMSRQEFSIGSQADGALFNSELSIKVGGEEKMKALLRHMSPEVAGDDKPDQMAYHVSPFVIPPSQVINPELNILDAAGNCVIEVAFVGYKISENRG